MKDLEVVALIKALSIHCFDFFLQFVQYFGQKQLHLIGAKYVTVTANLGLVQFLRLRTHGGHQELSYQGRKIGDRSKSRTIPLYQPHCGEVSDQRHVR